MRGRSRAAEAIRRLRCEQSGSTAIEYALVAGLIFLALTAALASYGNSAGSLYSNLANRFLSAMQ